MIRIALLASQHRALVIREVASNELPMLELDTSNPLESLVAERCSVTRRYGSRKRLPALPHGAPR